MGAMPKASVIVNPAASMPRAAPTIRTLLFERSLIRSTCASSWKRPRSAGAMSGDARRLQVANLSSISRVSPCVGHRWASWYVQLGMRPLRRRLRWMVLAMYAVVAILTASALAQAQAPGSRRATELSEAGRTAASLGEYDFAIQAYSEARRLKHDPASLFLLAEAHRQRHALARDEADLARAIEHFRRYLAAVPSGPHAPRARQALDALTPKLQQTQLDALLAQPEATPVTRLLVASSTLGAAARVDGGKMHKLPMVVIIEPGRHEVAIAATGYRTKEVRFVADRGSIEILRRKLDPMPAQLVVVGPVGASVYVDGDFASTLPVEAPIDVEPGHHALTVSANGYHSHHRALDLTRGKRASIEVDLDQTGQRMGAIALLAGGAVGMGVGIVFGVASVVKQRESASDGDEADAAREDFRLASGLSAGVGMVMLAAGGALFVLDAPPSAEAAGDVSALPVLGPDLAGMRVSLAF